VLQLHKTCSLDLEYNLAIFKNFNIKSSDNMYLQKGVPIKRLQKWAEFEENKNERDQLIKGKWDA
jgi:hypothetical protein